VPFQKERDSSNNHTVKPNPDFVPFDWPEFVVLDKYQTTQHEKWQNFMIFLTR